MEVSDLLKKITRAEFSALLVRIFDLTDTSGAKDFSDVGSDRWYGDYVSLVSGAKLMYEDGDIFRPDEPVTREEAAYAIARAYKLDPSLDNDFTDKDSISQWASNPVSALAEKGLVKGYLDGSFGPKDGISRAELVVILDRAMLAMDTGQEGIFKYQVSGKVTYLGKPTPGADVQIGQENGPFFREIADEDGNYIFKNLPSNGSYKMEAVFYDKDKFAYIKTIEELVVDSKKLVDIEMERIPVLSILVTDKYDRPITSGVEIVKVWDEDRVLSWETGADGYATILFDMEDDSEREFNFYIEDTYVGNLKGVKKAPGFKFEYTVKLDLSIADSISGKVLYKDKSIAKGLPVFLYKMDLTKKDDPSWEVVKETATDDKGDYFLEVPDTNADYYVISEIIEGENYFSSWGINLLLYDKNNPLIIEQITTLKLNVRDKDNTPIPQALFRVISEEGWYAWDYTDDDGNAFVYFKEFVPGNYIVEVKVGDNLITEKLTIREDKYNYKLDLKYK